MSDRGFWERSWQPESQFGLILSIASTYVLAAVFWWVGIAKVPDTLMTLSVFEYAGGFVLGLLFSVGVLSVHARPELRERWRKDRWLRGKVILPVGIMLFIIFIFSPAIVSLGFVVLAVGFTLGRTYLYIYERDIN